MVEVSAAGNIALARGWQTFTRVRGLGRRCTLHFKYDSGLTLYVRVFREDGRRAGCCPKMNDGEEVLGLGDGRDEEEGEPALSGDRISSSYGGSPSCDSSNSSGYDQPPRSLRRRQRVISSPRLREARGGVWLGLGAAKGLPPRIAETPLCLVFPFLFLHQKMKPVWAQRGVYRTVVLG